ncbi:hypothetical protein J2749_001563 [Methanobacterium oryzae]
MVYLEKSISMGVRFLIAGIMCIIISLLTLYKKDDSYIFTHKNYNHYKKFNERYNYKTLAIIEFLLGIIMLISAFFIDDLPGIDIYF